MKRGLAVALGLSALLTGMSGARAEWSASIGAEHFKWGETTTPNVRETGLRWALDLTWTQSREPGFSAGYNLKIYTGNVDYDGAFIGSPLPISGNVRYSGYTNELQLIYRSAWNPSSPIDFIGAFGWDHWDRKLMAPQTETWDVLYAKLGVAFNSATKEGFMGGGGFKMPVYTRENAHLTDLGFSDSPRIHPGRTFSLHGTLGYRFNPGWDVIGYYDSYRFKQSENVFVMQGGALFAVWQPQSKMDVVGVKVQHNF